MPWWAVPGSPLPLHTAWKNFGEYLGRSSFDFDMGFNSRTALAGAQSGGGDTFNQNEVNFDNVNIGGEDDWLRFRQMVMQAIKEVTA